MLECRVGLIFFSLGFIYSVGTAKILAGLLVLATKNICSNDDSYPREHSGYGRHHRAGTHPFLWWTCLDDSPIYIHIYKYI